MFLRTSLIVVLLCAATFVGVSVVTGQDQTPASSPSHDSQLLNELRELRQAVGGSVLGGTALEPSPDEAEADFDAGLRKVLGIAPAASSLKIEAVKAVSPKLSTAQIVSMLRKHSSELDKISNEIEHLRRYDNADQLRATATELRRLARQFDATTIRCPSAAEN